VGLYGRIYSARLDTLFMAKMAAKWLKSIPYLWPKWLKHHTLWNHTYLYSPYKGVHPPPWGLVMHYLVSYVLYFILYYTRLYYYYTRKYSQSEDRKAMVCLMALHPIFQSCPVFSVAWYKIVILFQFFFMVYLLNLWLTEYKGRTGEYWSEVVTVWIKHSEVYIKTTKGHQYFSVQLKQTRLVSVIWLYQQSWKCKLATVMSWKADVSSMLALRQSEFVISHSLWRRANAWNVSLSTRYGGQFTFQLSWYNQITLLPPPTQHLSFFRNFHP